MRWRGLDRNAHEPLHAAYFGGPTLQSARWFCLYSQHRTASRLQVRWYRSLEEVPVDAPAIILAHEFFDALPVHQFQARTA